MTRKPVATKIAMLLSSVGPEALERYNNFECQEGEDKAKCNHVKTKLDTELEGQKRIVFSNYPFWDHSKTSGQTFDEFLSQPSLSCEFAELNNMIRDRKSRAKRAAATRTEARPTEGRRYFLILGAGI